MPLTGSTVHTTAVSGSMSIPEILFNSLVSTRNLMVQFRCISHLDKITDAEAFVTLNSDVIYVSVLMCLSALKVYQVIFTTWHIRRVYDSNSAIQYDRDLRGTFSNIYTPLIIIGDALSRLHNPPHGAKQRSACMGREPLRPVNISTSYLVACSLDSWTVLHSGDSILSPILFSTQTY